MTPLLVGTALALAALLFVLHPLLFDDGASAAPPAGGGVVHAPAAGGDAAVEALREIEFDRATGKLSDSDYAELKATYTRQALDEMRRGDAAAATAASSAAATGSPDAAELAVRRARAVVGDAVVACPVHGLRPEPDAIYCSDCGRYLAGRCTSCGADVTREGARFCEGCGNRLAA
jgi:hypothetical protein